jgi:hypothetical protein
MIFRVTALLKDNTLIEGWAHDETEFRQKLSTKYGELAATAFIYTAGSEPHNLSWQSVEYLHSRGHNDEVIKRVFDFEVGQTIQMED